MLHGVHPDYPYMREGRLKWTFPWKLVYDNKNGDLHYFNEQLLIFEPQKRTNYQQLEPSSWYDYILIKL